MNPQRPVNSFRNLTQPPRPRPKAAHGASQRLQKTGRWQQARRFMRERPLLERVYWFCVKAFLWLFFGSIGYVVVLKYVPVWVTPLIVSRWIDTMGTDENSHVYKKWRSYDELSKEAALAVVASEDQAFPTHWGFDFDEIQDAIKENQYRKRPRGASTISQQVAKNVFLWNGRSYIRKGLEVYFTALIELIWGKKRILEVYLNVAETGPMTFGLEAASVRYYKHPASSLSRSEAARIAAVLPNPRLFSISNPSSYIQRRTRQISRQMRALGGQRYIRNL
ncbi:monofunctional biosynthetic peptidoglycan transglycosylase [Spirosoma utsteinense]|uniref:Biosynthetic peptidoglycan transglycosylase n=1 Tax=Spirosoma utsteinense TaxID=2585773 RepID=A0ABR6W9T2_9BACT|nr:monofunctional biosynthetic peptidoglycan transglycosylase [Spirosoma utsteinense]MBC3786745.1 monofunctional biosynthetic peptidoglycan transglycosylase [Spirosoma utsteinense]MBC3793313.1 monofunctional biosynthetic peptidoglycan transglycosylase [Spirosoma utsteinense]